MAMYIHNIASHKVCLELAVIELKVQNNSFEVVYIEVHILHALIMHEILCIAEASCSCCHHLRVDRLKTVWEFLER